MNLVKTPNLFSFPHFSRAVLAFGCLIFVFRKTYKFLTDFRPGLKFLAIKICAFLPIIQTFIFNMMVKDGKITEDDAIVCNNALICMEMLPISVLVFYAFDLKTIAEEGTELVNKVEQA